MEIFITLQLVGSVVVQIHQLGHCQAETEYGIYKHYINFIKKKIVNSVCNLLKILL